MMTKEKYIIGSDIGGTTFTTTVYDWDLEVVDFSSKALISDYHTTEDLLYGIAAQIHDLERRNRLFPGQISGIGMACPGPLDSQSGVILNTPNLKLLRNFPIASEIHKKLKSKVYIENDANLFALGEWTNNKHRNPKVLVSITLGTGLGFGIVIKSQLFTGAHGMAAEYGISPMDNGKWEDGIAIRGINRLSINKFNRIYSPKELYDMANSGDVDALEIWSVYGVRIGVFLSHAINMLDPDLITIGGGISHAFPLFCESMFSEISRHCPAYNHYKPAILESLEKEKSAMLGAAKLVKNNW